MLSTKQLCFVLCLGLLVQFTSAVRIMTFAGPSCTQNIIHDVEITPENSWLNLCGASVRSLVIPANTTIAFYEQCRDQSIFQVDANFKQFIKTDTFGNCVTFFAEEGEDINKISVSAQVVSGMNEVCQEYASHVDEYCQDSCNKNCKDSIRYARRMGNECKDAQVSTAVFDNRQRRRDHHHHDESSSSSSSHSEHMENEEEPVHEELPEHEEQPEQEEEREPCQEEQKKANSHNQQPRRKRFTLLKSLRRMAKGDHRRVVAKQADQNRVAPSERKQGTTNYKTFLKNYNRSCKNERGHGPMAIGCSVAFTLFVAAIFCCCCRRCYRKNCNKKCQTQAVTVPREMDSPSRVVIATIVPASMITNIENVQPVTVESRAVTNQQAKQIEADHLFAVELSRQ